MKMAKYYYVCPSCGRTVNKINKDGECRQCATGKTNMSDIPFTAAWHKKRGNKFFR